MNIKIDALNYYGATKKYHLHFPALREDIEADVVIIGGGFSGINTALELAEQGDHQRGGAGGAPSRLRRHRAQRRPR